MPILNLIVNNHLFAPTEPNDESGANVDASKMWREDREQFNRLAKQIVRKSLGLWLSCVQTHSHTPGQWGLTFTRIWAPRGRVSVVVYYPPYLHQCEHFIPIQAFILSSQSSPLLWLGGCVDKWLLLKKAKCHAFTGQCFNRESIITHWNVFHGHFGLPVCLSCLLHVYWSMR